MRREKGITLLALIITIIIMALLAGAVINYGVDSYSTIKFQNFKYELEQVQGKVNVIMEKIKTGDESYITLGSDITVSDDAVDLLRLIKGINYSNILTSQRATYYYEDTYTYYRYLTESQVQSLLDISSNPGDLIINFKTGDVISVNGFTYKETTYYTLSQM